VPCFEGVDDAVGVGSPGKRFGIMIGFVDEAIDGGVELSDGTEHSAKESFAGPNRYI
jgi:hypothetical protein